MLIRQAVAADLDAIYDLIYELAVFERAAHEFINTKENLLKDGFSENPVYICFVLEIEGKICGMSLCYLRYSTWKGTCLYLEDLIITESMRGKGLGKALFAHTIQYAKEKQYARLAWQVLDWNESAIRFYRSFDASLESEWMNGWIEF